ncbi:MAG TPA: PEGA domain-containing protein [Polyangiaceae bacterium]|nr:PEGA domain-containing protein [Polyangiaceae bacterium]
MKHLLSLAALLCLGLAGGPARAGNDSSKTAQASTHFQRGVQLYRQRSFDAALAEFEKSYELAPDYHLLFNLAQVQLERHDYVAALKRFREYLQLGDTQIDATRRSEVEQEIARIDDFVAEVSFVVTPEGTQVSLDGTDLGTAPLAAPVVINSGVHRVLLSKPGFTPVQQTLTVAGGDSPRVVVSLRPTQAEATPVAAGAPTTPQSAASDRSGSTAPSEAKHSTRAERSNTGLWLSLGATVAFGGASGVMAVVTNDAKRKFSDELDRFGASRDDVDSARSKLKTDALVTDVLAGAALVSAGFCVYFIASGGSASEESPPPRLGVGLAPRGVFAHGTF